MFFLSAMDMISLKFAELDRNIIMSDHYFLSTVKRPDRKAIYG
jgi:hypothetical protein